MRAMPLRTDRWAAAVLLIAALHGALAWNAVNRLSPTWDEIAFPLSGLAQWRTGEIAFNRVNPFLSKTFYALPLLALGAPLPVTHLAWAARDDYRTGFLFTYRNTLPPRRLIRAGRSMAVLFSLATIVLLAAIGRAAAGPPGGALAAAVYAVTPILVSRASIAQAEMPMYFFMVLALGLHGLWARNRRTSTLLAAGASAGLAALCKLAALPLVPLVFLWEWVRPDRAQREIDRLKAPTIFSLTAAALFVLAYLPWRGGTDALAAAWDNLSRFDKIIPYYFHERVWLEGSTFLSWGAFAVKAPPAVLGLALLGAAGWWRSGRDRGGLFRWGLLSTLALGAVIFFDQPVSTVQLSPFYLGAVVLSTGIVHWAGRARRWTSAAAGILLAVGAVSMARSHPNLLGYFNFMAGGPENGWRWLADSDHDWGQGLPLLAEDQRRDPAGTLLLAYSGSGDPEAHGIRYVDFFSPALVSRERRDDLSSPPRGPVVLAVATKLLQTNPELFEIPLRRWSPRARVGHCFILWTLDTPEAFAWLRDSYAAMGRGDHARWAASATSG